MDKFLKPQVFETEPSSPTAAKQWNHWLKTFENFIAAIATLNNEPNKLTTLINYVNHDVYDLISECTSYDDAIETLRNIYVQPKNEVFARHLLATRKQKAGETLEEFLQSLRQSAKDCNFVAVTAESYRDESIRDAFINGLSSNNIRQRLLENKTLDLKTAYDQARSLDIAQKATVSYGITDPFPSAAAASSSSTSSSAPPSTDTSTESAAATVSKQRCFFMR